MTWGHLVCCEYAALPEREGRLTQVTNGSIMTPDTSIIQTPLGCPLSQQGYNGDVGPNGPECIDPE